MLKKSRSYLYNLQSSLHRDQRAAVLPIFGMMFIFLVVVAGAAIDISRAVSAREKLSYAIDAAALSVATDLSTTLLSNSKIKTRIENSFKANLADASFLDKAIENLSFVVDSDEGTISVTSSATLDNYFIDIGGYGVEAFGPDAFAFGTSAQVKYATKDIELALVMDVTGSMRRDMDALRAAAKSAVNILVPDSAEDAASKLRISIVPYSQGVNLGSNASKVTNGVSTWKDCVTERPGPKQLTDAIYNYDGNNSEFFKASGDETYWNGEKQDPPWGDSCPDEEILPLTDDKDTLLEKISALDDGGGTAGQTGIAWGWYTLSPNWSSLWPAKSQPAAYQPGEPSDEVSKIAIIMTDGNFNDYFENVEKKSTQEVCKKVKKKKKNGKYKWVTKCKDEEVTELIWTEIYHEYSSISDPSAVRGLAFCEAMKTNNIEIYSIFFKTSSSGFAETLMKSCASDDKDDHYYLASSKEELESAYENIAKKIQAIHLSR